MVLFIIIFSVLVFGTLIAMFCLTEDDEALHKDYKHNKYLQANKKLKKYNQF